MTNLFTTTLNASVKNQGTVNEDAELFYQFSKIPLIYLGECSRKFHFHPTYLEIRRLSSNPVSSCSKHPLPFYTDTHTPRITLLYIIHVTNSPVTCAKSFSPAKSPVSATTVVSFLSWSREDAMMWKNIANSRIFPICSANTRTSLRLINTRHYWSSFTV